MAKKNGKKKDWLWVLIVPVVVVLSIGIWWYVATNEVRRYEAASYEMKLIAERQKLEIDIYNQSNQLQQIRQQVQQAQQQVQQQAQQQVQLQPEPTLPQLFSGVEE